ncbi:MAG: GTP cyclohydrolase FolE2, partial [Rickettsiales bacterium]
MPNKEEELKEIREIGTKISGIYTGLKYAINVELPSRRGKGEHLSRLETRIEQEKNEIKQSKEKLSKL